jgi:DNA-directed RNA polymerase subunit RPC12/RpoP
MLASKCTKCGKHFVGWSLSVPDNQKCPRCGSKLAIHDEAAELDLDYERLRQSMDTNLEEWQEALEKTLAVYFRDRDYRTLPAN